MTYDFNERLQYGERYEHYLDTVFQSGFDIAPATHGEQREGIDRHYTSRITGNRFTVEYKTDKTASKTGNAFVETVSVDTANKPGWAYSSKAKYLIYLVPGNNEAIYIIPFAELRKHLRRWLHHYPTRKIPNKGYYTIGLIVPLEEFEKCAETVR